MIVSLGFNSVFRQKLANNIKEIQPEGIEKLDSQTLGQSCDRCVADGGERFRN